MLPEFVMRGAALVVTAFGGGLVAAPEAGPSQGVLCALTVTCSRAASCHELADLRQAERDEERSVSAAPLSVMLAAAMAARKA
ncbi:hypothetical protein, partial [Streptomyces flavidovirens]|uniref:hypothetical protein n=1 Tax=Streptomyces flavidovirens TaxID=67298 RepID=UPI001AD7FBCA